MNTRENLEEITQENLKNLVASSILRKEKFRKEDILKEVLEKLNMLGKFALKKTVKRCIENTIKSLYLSNCYQLENGKYILTKRMFLD